MKRNNSKTGQKAALVGLLFLGIVTLGLGYMKVRSQIAGPFEAQISRAQESTLAQFFEQQAAQDDVEAQKKSDTDSDGLSDYDELNVHRTSPYLKDTDSDGYDDKTEIDTQNDPNCAKGKVCFVASASNTKGSGTDSLRETEPDPVTVQPSSVSALEADLKKLESITPAQVRELLKQKGFSDQDLADVDDEALIALYRESLQKALEMEKQKKGSGSVSRSESVPDPASGLPGANASNLSQQQIAQELAGLTKPQIIQMLQETGQLSTEQLGTLQQLEEAQVKAIFMQALENAQAQYDAKRQ